MHLRSTYSFIKTYKSTDTSLTVTGLSQIFNLEDGSNTTVEPAPSYYNFESSNLDVAIVNELGEITIIGEGTTVITAQLAGVLAEGSLTLESLWTGYSIWENPKK